MDSQFAEKKQAVESIHSAEIGDFTIIEYPSDYEGRNWFQRNLIDGFKPPVDSHSYESMTPEERAIILLNRGGPKLQRRHLMVIALSSCVGTGMFIGSGTSLKVGGPGALLLGFGIIGICLLITMSVIGEMGLRYPSVSVLYELPSRFVHPSLGFAVGWLYTLAFLVSIPIELIAAGELTQFWRNDNNSAAKANPVAWVALIYFLDCIINLGGSYFMAELEFVVGIVKVLGIAGFIIFSIIQACGGPPTNHYLGVHNFHNPRAFMHSFKGLVQVIVSCSFAYGGTELSGIAAAETSNPVLAIPSTVRQSFWRIIFFYIFAMFMVCLTVPPTTPGLGNSNTGSGSPFIAAVTIAGVKALPSIFNAVILFSIFGVSNAIIYASYRSLTSLAIKGANLKCFCYVDREGRPLVSIVVSLLFGALCFVCASDKYNDVFNWLYAFAALAYLYGWTFLNISYIRMRLAMRAQSVSPKELLYQSPFGIPGSIVAASIAIATLGLQFWVYIFPIGGKPDPVIFFQNELSVPFFIVLAVGHKIWYWKSSRWVPNNELDVHSGVRIVDMEALKKQMREDKEKARKNIFRLLAAHLC